MQHDPEFAAFLEALDRGKTVSADEIAASQGSDAGERSERPAPSYRSKNKQSVIAWIDEGFPEPAPEYPLTSTLIDAAIGRRATRCGLQLMHIVFAECYRTRQRQVTLAKAILAKFMGTQTWRINKIVDCLPEWMITTNVTGLKSGAIGFEAHIFDAVDVSRSEVTITISNQVAAEIFFPKLYAHISLADVRAIDCTYALSLMPHAVFFGTTRTKTGMREVSMRLDGQEAADLMNASQGPNRKLPPSKIKDRAKAAAKGFEKAISFEAELNVATSKFSRKETLVIFNVEMKPQAAAYAQLPNRMIPFFQLKAPTDLHIHFSKFVYLVREKGIEPDADSARVVHLAWKLWLYDNQATDKKSWADFCKKMKGIEGFGTADRSKEDREAAVAYYQKITAVRKTEKVSDDELDAVIDTAEPEDRPAPLQVAEIKPEKVAEVKSEEISQPEAPKVPAPVPTPKPSSGFIEHDFDVEIVENKGGATIGGATFIKGDSRNFFFGGESELADKNGLLIEIYLGRPRQMVRRAGGWVDLGSTKYEGEIYSDVKVIDDLINDLSDDSLIAEIEAEIAKI